MEYFHHVQHTQFPLSDRRKYIKKTCAGKKTKLGINKQKRFQTNGRGSLLNLTKVQITTKRNGSMNLNMEKGGIKMNITMMTLI